MPRPKGEPTKVVRLPIALLEQAARTGRTPAEVFAAGLADADAAPRPTRPSAPGTAAQGRSPKVSHPKPTAAVPIARPVRGAPREVDPAAMARQAKMNAAKSGKR